MGVLSIPSTVAFRRKDYGSFVCCDIKKAPLYVSSEDELIVSPKARFIVEPSAKHRGLVHIKSYYTNSFWCRENERSWVLTTIAKEPVEDLLEWNCTLFRFQILPSSGCVKLYHCGTNLCVATNRNRQPPFLYISNLGDFEYFDPIDLNSITKLPKHVTFKDNKGRILLAGWKEGHQYHQFYAGDHIGERAVYEIFYTKDGDIRVKSMYFGKFWRRSPNWIWADSTDTSSNNKDTVFELVSRGENEIVLRNKGNNNYCIGLTKERKHSCLNADVGSMSGASLFVGEPVLSRTTEVHYRLMDARVCSRKPLQVGSVTIPNNTSRDHEAVQGFTYTNTKAKTWSTSFSTKCCAKANARCGIPILAEAKAEVSTEIVAGLQFGESKTTTEQVTSRYKVPVPARNKAIIKMFSTQATYDIPFSYTNIDTTYDGKKKSTLFEDGMYRGVEAIDFFYESKYQPI